MTTQLPKMAADPWSVSPTNGSRNASVVGSAVAAWALGSSGPAADLLRQAALGRALVLLVLTACWEVILRRRVGPCHLALLPLGVGLLAGTLAVWHVGFGAVALSLVGVFVADAALVEWKPTRAWPQRRSSRATLALPLIVLAEVTWLRSAATGVAILVLIASLLVVESYHRFPGPLEVADRSFRRVVEAVVELVANAVLFVVALLVVYLPGLVLRAARGVIGRTRPAAPTSWVVAGIDAADQRRDARYPFVSTDRRTRAHRHVVATAILVVALVAVAVAVRSQRSPGGTIFDPPSPVAFSDRPAYVGSDWADELQAEQELLSKRNLVPSAATRSRVADFEGTYTHVDDGLRTTTAAPSCECPRRTVWFVGGSAAFGLGQRDAHTIASELVRLGLQDGLSLTVRNMAAPGWTIHQERLAVEERLRGGSEQPDLVIFYDGFNDAVGTVISSALTGPDPRVPALFDYAEIQAFTNNQIDPSQGGTPAVLGRLSAEKYSWERRAIADLLDGLGIASAFFFQPDAFADPFQYESVEAVLSEPIRVHREFVDEVLRTASAELSAEVVNLRDAYDGQERPLFADPVHTNETAAEISAAAIYERVRPNFLG